MAGFVVFFCVTVAAETLLPSPTAINAHIVIAVTAIFIFFFIPETKDRTLEEIDEMFQNRVAPRKFSGYQCVASAQAREHGAAKMGEKGALEHVESVAVE